MWSPLSFVFCMVSCVINVMFILSAVSSTFVILVCLSHTWQDRNEHKASCSVPAIISKSNKSWLRLTDFNKNTHCKILWKSVSHLVSCLLFLSKLNETWPRLTDLNKNTLHKILWKSIHWEPRWWIDVWVER